MVLALPQLVRQAQLKAAKGRTPRWLERRELPQPRRLTVELQLVLVLALALCLGRATVAAAQAEPAERAWLDWRLAAPVRAAALARALTLDEKAAQLTSASPRLDRLGVPAYHWRNNVLHGVVDNGVSTVFPQAIALGATWDAELLQRSGLAWGLEQRSKYNAARRRAAGPPGSELRDSPMNFGLDLWYVERARAPLFLFAGRLTLLS